jgi:GTP-binding protein HflX
VRGPGSSSALFVSALAPETLGALKEALKARLRQRLRAVRVDLPFRDGELLAAIYREGEVLSREDSDTSVALTARLPPALLGRLRRRQGITVQDVA